ncbi:hypothetical protein BRADI_4g24333v3 [Brachypodium distachyon]|uniref:Uncharacterized protein n=1 Tax=Brachypodium distachyon TaxID=15368 RepID=A0A2K2CPY4_BRADI|nr:hypothetical protein BRADI_4g24333v3 [Brachypodium distachyon]PNT64085.1 hypothetical protein BRADI_4g24333v3 [Brachypodium distachyon]
MDLGGASSLSHSLLFWIPQCQRNAQMRTMDSPLAYQGCSCDLLHSTWRRCAQEFKQDVSKMTEPGPIRRSRATRADVPDLWPGSLRRRRLLTYSSSPDLKDIFINSVHRKNRLLESEANP